MTPHTGRDQGSVAAWVPPTVLLLLVLGGLSLDVWMGLSERRVIAGVADAAAAAGSTGVDPGVFRETGELVLDSAEARARAVSSLAQHEEMFDTADVAVSTDLTVVEVTVAQHTDALLLRLAGSDGYHMSATATASPGDEPLTEGG